MTTQKFKWNGYETSSTLYMFLLVFLDLTVHNVQKIFL